MSRERKERIVTRTVAMKSADVLCINLNDNSVKRESVTFYAGNCRNDEDIRTAISLYIPEGFVIAHIVAISDFEKTYAIPEKFFPAYGVEIERNKTE